MTLFDGDRRVPRTTDRMMTSAEEGAVMRLLSLTGVPSIWVPAGMDHMERVWARLQVKADEWKLSPLEAAQRLEQAEIRGLRPEW